MTLELSQSSGAPEQDTSIAPQVPFLLTVKKYKCIKKTNGSFNLTIISQQSDLVLTDSPVFMAVIISLVSIILQV